MSKRRASGPSPARPAPRIRDFDGSDADFTKVLPPLLPPPLPPAKNVGGVAVGAVQVNELDELMCQELHMKGKPAHPAYGMGTPSPPALADPPAAPLP